MKFVWSRAAATSFWTLEAADRNEAYRRVLACLMAERGIDLELAVLAFARGDELHEVTGDVIDSPVTGDLPDESEVLDIRGLPHPDDLPLAALGPTSWRFDELPGMV